MQLKALMDEECARTMINAIDAVDKEPGKQESMHERVYSDMRLMVYVRMGGREQNFKYVIREAWMSLKLSPTQARDGVENWWVNVQNLRRLAYEVDINLDTYAGRREEVGCGMQRIELGTRL